MTALSTEQIIFQERHLEIEEANSLSFLLEEESLRDSLPDGKAYYDHIIKNVELDRNNPKNSYIMYLAGKVDKIDLTKPCAFTKASTALPDIDVDFPTDYREKAIDYVRNKYGQDKVCQITTFGRLSGRSAVKAVMRVEGGYDFETMNMVTEGIPDEAAISDQLEETGEDSIISWMLHNSPDAVSDYCRIEDGILVGDYAEIFRKAIALEGTFQNQGKHAAGVIISSEKVAEVSPMCLSKDGVPIAAFDMAWLEKAGLVKFDFLGVDILNKIQEAWGPDIVNVPLDDEEAWDVICGGNTKGCFQIENHLGRDWSKEIRPRNMEELSAVIAGIRPGCVSGDTPVAVKSNYEHRNGSKRKHIKYVPMRKIFKNKKCYKQLRSIDKNGLIINNDIVDVFYTGEKECFKLKIRRYRKFRTISYLGSGQYPLECTEDHKLLTPTGWKELKDIEIGERIAARKFSAPKSLRSETRSNRHVPGLRVKNCEGSRSYPDICYKNYLEQCCVCGWSKANLDTNHINGNRTVDNSPDNLCFLCPNCHREFTLGYIGETELRKYQLASRLPSLEDIEWITYEGKESVGIKDVYDISMGAPHHNFIAGNIVVHNCLLVKDTNGRSMTKVYADRKNGIESIVDTPINKIIPTYGVLIYQETLLNIAKQLAGFNSADSIKLMKSVGKKDAKLLFSLENQFVNGCTHKNVISKDDAIKLFEDIKKSARYLFNLSHSISYSYPSYWSAYIKAHKPLKFYEVWLKYSSHKLDPHAEVRNLVLSAKLDNVEILPPSCEYLTNGFFIKGNAVVFGLTHIKGVANRELDKLFGLMRHHGVRASVVTYLTEILPDINKRTCEALINCGCFQYLGISRAALLHYYECFSELSDKELVFFQDKTFGSPEEALRAAAGLKKEGGACSTKGRVEKVNIILERLRNPGRILHDLPGKIAAAEEAAIGTTLSLSYMDTCLAAGVADTTCREILRGKPGKRTIVVRVIEVKEHIIKSSDKKMAFLVVEDDSAEIDNVVCFADQYEQYGRFLYDGAMVAIYGELGKKRSFVIDRVVEL